MIRKIFIALIFCMSLPAVAGDINFDVSGVFFEHTDGGNPAIAGAENWVHPKLHTDKARISRPLNGFLG